MESTISYRDPYASARIQTAPTVIENKSTPNRVTASSLGRQVLDVMRENEIEFLDAKLGNRTSFQEATIRGSVPSQMGSAHKVAAAEVEAVTTELLSRLGWK